MSVFGAGPGGRVGPGEEELSDILGCFEAGGLAEMLKEAAKGNSSYELYLIFERLCCKRCLRGMDVGRWGLFLSRRLVVVVMILNYRDRVAKYLRKHPKSLRKGCENRHRMSPESLQSLI